MSSFWHSRLSLNRSYTDEYGIPLSFQKKGWLKMISFIKSFCKYRRFMSNPTNRQAFEEYLHLEVQSSKESKSLLYLLPFLLTFQTQGLAQIRSCRAVCVMPVLALGLARTPGPGYKAKVTSAYKGCESSGFCLQSHQWWRMTSLAKAQQDLIFYKTICPQYRFIPLLYLLFHSFIQHFLRIHYGAGTLPDARDTVVNMQHMFS